MFLRGDLMKKLLRLLSLSALIFTFVVFPLKPLYTEASPRRADFGDFSGDSDFGDSGGWDSGDSWDSGWDSDDSWDSGGSYSSSGSGNGIDAVFVIIIIIVIIIYSASSNKKRSNTTYSPPTVNTPSLRRIE